MLVAVEQRVLVVLGTTTATRGGLVCLETGIGKHNDETLRVFVARRDGNVLLGYELRQRWRWETLGALRFRFDVSHGEVLVGRTS